MQRSARTPHTMRPSRSFSSTMQPATGQAAWQIEHAKAPKHRSGSITAIVFGAFLRGPVIILVHIFIRGPLPHVAPRRSGALEDYSGSVSWVPDSGFLFQILVFRFQIPDCRFQILDSRS